MIAIAFVGKSANGRGGIIRDDACLINMLVEIDKV
jgi:hypothetical protein